MRHLAYGIKRVRAGTSKYQHPSNRECVFAQGDWESLAWAPGGMSGGGGRGGLCCRG